MASNGASRGAVVITGASTGIGEATALRLDRAGFTVYAGVRREADGERLRAQASGALTPLLIDVTSQETIDAAAKTVAEHVDRRGIAGLVNNAGISVAGPMEFLPLERLRQQFEVNVFGQIAVTQAFMPFIRIGHGRIVNIGSISGRMSTPFLAPYSASKFSMEAISDSLRMELRPWGIKVALIEPGSIATPIWETSLARADEIEREIGPDDTALYKKQVDAMRVAAKELEGRGIPPDKVAQAIEHALTAKRPKTRYLVGNDARLQAVLAKWAPDRLKDRLIAMQMKLPR
jgi:NAD(P)-dependent dehydrogenase (short-subunit alcohol dehydrogenase family)